MSIISYTLENKPVIGGIFKLVSEKGIPLSTIVEFLHTKNYEIDWLGFYLDARKENWTINTIFSRIRESLIDSGYKNKWSEIELRLKVCIGKLHNEGKLNTFTIEEYYKSKNQ